MSRVELTQFSVESSRVKLKIWATRLDLNSSSKSQLETQLDDQSIFDWVQADKLSSHHSYDHKIELTSDATSLCCRAYWMSLYKLQKVKKYLNENLFKEFITSSKASYFSSVLFILKANNVRNQHRASHMNVI